MKNIKKTLLFCSIIIFMSPGISAMNKTNLTIEDIICRLNESEKKLTNPNEHNEKRYTEQKDFFDNCARKYSYTQLINYLTYSSLTCSSERSDSPKSLIILSKSSSPTEKESIDIISYTIQTLQNFLKSKPDEEEYILRFIKKAQTIIDHIKISEILHSLIEKENKKLTRTEIEKEALEKSEELQNNESLNESLVNICKNYIDILKERLDLGVSIGLYTEKFLMEIKMHLSLKTL